MLSAMPLKCYWASLPESARGSWDSWLKKAQRKQIDGLYKQGDDWWINLAAHASKGLESANEKEEATAKKAQGYGVDHQTREHVLRPGQTAGGGKTNATLRVRRGGKQTA